MNTPATIHRIAILALIADLTAEMSTIAASWAADADTNDRLEAIQDDLTALYTDLDEMADDE